MVRSEDLTESQRAVLVGITRGRLAWSTTAEIIGYVLPCDSFEELAVVLAELIALELVDEWMLPSEPHYTLTPYGAWLMGVHILERLSIRGEEIEEDPYWAELDKEPPPLHLPKRRHEIRWPWMEELPDPKSLKRSAEVMRDEDGEEVKVLGMSVPVDRRLKGAKGKGAKAKQPKARRRAG